MSKYRPKAGTTYWLSGRYDDGPVFNEVAILWCDEIFVVYQIKGC